MKKSIVRDIHAADTHNLEESLRLLGELADLPYEIAKLYDQVNEAVAPSATTEAESCAVVLYARASLFLATGATELFRLHSGKMFRETRAAIEAAGVAQLIQTDAESFEIFSADGDTEQARNAARKRFTSARLFPESRPDMEVLKGFYWIHSDLSHINRLTLMPHVGPNAGNGISVKPQDIEQTGGQVVLRQRLSWLCMAHLSIIVAAHSTFPRADVKGMIEKDLTYLMGRTERLRAASAGGT